MQLLKYSSWEGKEYPKSKNSMTKKENYILSISYICSVSTFHKQITENIHNKYDTNIRKLFVFLMQKGL